MFKLLSLFFIITYSYSDYLYTENTRCVYDLRPNDDGDGFCYRYRDGYDREYCSSSADLDDFVAGYEYVSGVCELDHDLAITGLSFADKNMIDAYMALAVFSAFIFALLTLL